MSPEEKVTAEMREPNWQHGERDEDADGGSAGLLQETQTGASLRRSCWRGGEL